MTKVKSAAAVLGALLALGACGGSGNEAESSKPTTAPTTGGSPSPFAPNLGSTALKVGETRHGQDVHTTLHEVKYPFPPAEYRQPDEGNVFLGLRIEQCLDEDVTEPGQSTYNGEWSAVTSAAEEFGGSGSSWNDWPEPKFPETVGMIPGRCLKGWMALQVPKSTKIQALLWRPDGVPVAEWMIEGSK